MNRGLAVAAVLCLTVASGCVVVDVGVTNPLPGLSKVAVVPFFNLSQERAADGRRFALAYYAELQKVPGFQVVPVGVAEQAIYDNGLQMSGPEDAIKLAQILGVDIVVIGAVTDYDPYYPPRIGLQVSWYSPYAVEVPSWPEGHADGGVAHCLWSGWFSRKRTAPFRATTVANISGRMLARQALRRGLVIRAQSHGPAESLEQQFKDGEQVLGEWQSAEKQPSEQMSDGEDKQGGPGQRKVSGRPSCAAPAPLAVEWSVASDSSVVTEAANRAEKDAGPGLSGVTDKRKDDGGAQRSDAAQSEATQGEQEPDAQTVESVAETSASALPSSDSSGDVESGRTSNPKQPAAVSDPVATPDSQPAEAKSEPPDTKSGVGSQASIQAETGQQQVSSVRQRNEDTATSKTAGKEQTPSQPPTSLQAAGLPDGQRKAVRPATGFIVTADQHAASAGQLATSEVSEPSEHDGQTAPTPRVLGEVDQSETLPAPNPLKPIMSYTRIFDGADPDLVAKLRDYVELSGDRRSGGWEAYLHRSEDFIRFTAHLMIVEMLSLHGGETRHRFVFKLRKQM